MELNVGLVRKESHHWVGQCLESYEDLVQVGCLGLLRAIERFNVEKGSAFSSFAIPYIRGEIQHYLRDKGYCVRIPRRWLELGQPTESEVAQILEISLSELRDIKLALQNREPISLDIKVDQDGDSLTNLGDCLADADYHSFQLSQEDQIRLQQAMGQLEERTRNVLEFVFLHDLTQRETADQLGISVITVSRRLKKGLKVLQNSLMAEVF
jgi:RNA polymerase sigma-B factor